MFFNKGDTLEGTGGNCRRTSSGISLVQDARYGGRSRHFFRTVVSRFVLKINTKYRVINHLDKFDRGKTKAWLWPLPCLIQGMTNHTEKGNAYKEEDNKDWRRLCREAADEPDPQRLSELVDQLIRALDARRQVQSRGGPNGGVPLNS